MSERIFPDGIRCFGPRDNAPDFVLGSVIITPNDLLTWLKANQHLLKEYNGNKQLRLNLTRNKDGKGINVSVDTYEGKTDAAPASAAPKSDTDLPF
jgi:hypothetical protein